MNGAYIERRRLDEFNTGEDLMNAKMEAVKFLLNCFVEEVAEAAQEYCKCIRFGATQVCPVTGLVNQQKLLLEYTDAIAIAGVISTIQRHECLLPPQGRYDDISATAGMAILSASKARRAIVLPVRVKHFSALADLLEDQYGGSTVDAARAKEKLNRLLQYMPYSVGQGMIGLDSVDIITRGTNKVLSMIGGEQ